MVIEPEDKREIKKLIQEKDFPDTSVLPVLGDIIRSVGIYNSRL